MVKTKRKRKIAVAINEEKENESETASATNVPVVNNGPMFKIMSHVQTSETLHKKYVKEMQELYTKMNHHEMFMRTFIRVIKAAMECDETNEYALTSLQFCAKFVASYDDEETHPVLISTFNWLLTTISNNPHIRFRLCQFVNIVLNALGQEAALDDAICDKILEYMVQRLRDISPSVRVQAIVAMQRLQVPDNPHDPVLSAYQFHLCSDPSPRVRQAVITYMGRNYITVPFILERLWDIDEKVRRHTYLHMSSFPVRSYKVSQRLTLLEQGLNDRVEAVKKVVTKIMLQQWLESYQKDIIALIKALKIDANESELERFRKVTKQMLQEVFKRENSEALIAQLPLETEGEFHRCVPHDKLSIEIALYWQCLSEYLQQQMSDDFDLVLPELSTFCFYIERFCEIQNPEMDVFENLKFQYTFMSLMEILYKYDLGDEIGRGNLKKLLARMLKNEHIDEKNIQIIARCAENLITDQNERMEFFINIVQELCNLNATQKNLWHDRELVNEALANCADPDLKFKLSELKVKILDFEEQEMMLLQSKNYVRAEEVTKLKSLVTEEYINLLKPLLPESLSIKKVKNENILVSLQIIFHMVVSEKVSSLNPQVCKLYNDFICRHVASSVIAIREWALKCGTAFSMHYEPIAKDLFNELFSQFFKHHNARIWETSVKCIFEIMDYYGIDNFAPQEPSPSNNPKRPGRQLYNTLTSLEMDDETPVSVDGQGVGVICMMSHFLDTCDNIAIVSEIILGFIRLTLHGHLKNNDIIEKLLLRYFNPRTDTKINQYLSIFLEEMIKLKKQSLLVPSLLPTLNAVLSAPYDSPLLEIRPETITRFFIDITRQDACPGQKVNLHNKIAHAFLTEMCNNANNKELCKLLAKEILKLELNIINCGSAKLEMKEMADKLILCELDSHTIKNIINLKDMLDGVFNPPVRTENDSDEEADDDTVTNDNPPSSTVLSRGPSEGRKSINTPVSTPNTPNETEEATLSNSEKTLTDNVTGAGEENATVARTTENSEQSPTVTEATETTQTQETPASEMESETTNTTTPAVAASQEKGMSPPPPIPRVITTYGRQNTIGNHCLRKSLNSSRTQSESEFSDANHTPLIRIEARFDSDKKKSPNESEKQIGVSNKTNRVINSASGRSLRALRGRRKSPSPLRSPRVNKKQAKSSKKTNDKNAMPSTVETIELSSSTDKDSSSDESIVSDVIPASPQVSINQSSRLLRVARNSTHLSSPKANRPLRSARKGKAITNSASKAPQSPASKSQTPSPKRTASPKATTPTKTASPETTTTNKSATPKPRKTPRKAIYKRIAPLQLSGRKRTLPKTPYAKKKNQDSQAADSSSSSTTKSPRPKHPRRGNLYEEMETESDATGISIPSITSSPPRQRKINKLNPTTQNISKSTTKATENTSKNKNSPRRRKSLSNMTTNNSEEVASLGNVKGTRNAMRNIFRMENIMTRNRAAGSSSGSTSNPSTKKK